ncbi:myosin-like protein [Phytophthora infestans T30-4]|uniref:Myosin-like protein n=1 Tax=Phytophthora infestans (strain T30-4) TaxID=403677 RepID=D0NAA3_PHYIT|nr:myosin-like protein [Phytophthora infestans T30-4]EEY54761.1 myosin-like protein [Phytophthora infestans T30-4]|eukprot:XP_002903706.1 myosin-like protein [Phytophthora infestans T30-4]
MLEDKQQRERETQQLVDENHTLQSKVKDLTEQVQGAREQREDVEQMYMEVASKLNQALRDNDELKKPNSSGDRLRELETQLEAYEQDKLQFTQQVEALTAANDKATAELAEVADIRDKLLVHVGIDLTYESIESLLDTKNMEIQMLTEQLSAAEAPKEQAVREAVGAAVAEAESLQVKLEALQTEYNSLSSDRTEQDKTVAELRAELERVAAEHAASMEEQRRVCEETQVENEQLTARLCDVETQKQQLSDDFSAIKAKLEGLIIALPLDKLTSTESDTESSQVEELEACLEHIEKQLVGAAKPAKNDLESEVKTLQERIHKYETENQLLTAKLEECEAALKARASEIEKLVTKARSVSSDSNKCVSSGENAGCNGDAPERYNGDANDLELEATRAELHAVETEMAACKAENLRMIFEVAKTADGVSKLKQDHEELLQTHSKTASELRTTLVQLESLESAKKTLESDLHRTSESMRCNVETFAMQKEDFEAAIASLNGAVHTSEQENSKIKRDLEDIKTENDVLEERISELHAVADSKTEPDESQEKDREVEELRSSLVQAKVNFLEQKQQLTALEKKLVEVSKSSGPACAVNNAALDAERREFEAALIEMIEMEKKLQVAYEAKQGLESTLQERMEAKADLEGRLSIAEDKIAELEQQLEQKVALIATIEEQLRLVEEEREKLADEFAKTKSKLERSRGKLEEKAIEFEAFKTTTNMLKDERSRLFNEIALLKDKITKSEAQKAEMADSQELANEELEEQLNELADKIAEIEAEKQDLRARLEETVYRSEEDIHQLRERLYMLEEENSERVQFSAAESVGRESGQGG